MDIIDRLNAIEDDDDCFGDEGDGDADASLDDVVGGMPARKLKRQASTAEKKANHNAVERARRESLNGRFLKLADMLPGMNHVKRASKAAIVNKSIDLIRELRATEERLVVENERLRTEMAALKTRVPGSTPPPAAAAAAANQQAMLSHLLGVPNLQAAALQFGMNPLQTLPLGYPQMFGGYNPLAALHAQPSSGDETVVKSDSGSPTSLNNAPLHTTNSANVFAAPPSSYFDFGPPLDTLNLDGTSPLSNLGGAIKASPSPPRDPSPAYSPISSLPSLSTSVTAPSVTFETAPATTTGGNSPRSPASYTQEEFNNMPNQLAAQQAFKAQQEYQNYLNMQRIAGSHALPSAAGLSSAGAAAGMFGTGAFPGMIPDLSMFAPQQQQMMGQHAISQWLNQNVGHTLGYGMPIGAGGPAFNGQPGF